MSETFKVKGKIVVIDPVVEISATFRKREFVIYVENERNVDYSDYIKFQSTQDKCDVLNNFKAGDEAEVSFNVRGRKWEKEGKVNYFNSLDAWRVEPVEQQAPTGDDIPPSDPTDSLPF